MPAGPAASACERTDWEVTGLTVVEYQDQMASSWLHCWLLAAGGSKAWLWILNHRPRYKGESLQLVALEQDQVIGFLDVELEQAPGSLCLASAADQGFVWEFGVRPDRQQRGVGSALLQAAERQLKASYNVGYVEFWSTDPNAQSWYRAKGMELIDRHWRFHVRPSPEMKADVEAPGTAAQHLLMTCPWDSLAAAQARYHVLLESPIEPRLCHGYAHRF